MPLGMSAVGGKAVVACQGLSGTFLATSGHWRYAQITDYTPASEDERASDASRSRSLPPVEFYLGTRPIQAGRSRPDLKAWGLGMEATDNARAQALGCKKTQQKRPDTAPINRRAWSMRPGGLSASI
jgi:hypothetical protein